MSGGKPLLLLYAFKGCTGAVSALSIIKLCVWVLLMVVRVLDKISANSNISVFYRVIKKSLCTESYK